MFKYDIEKDCFLYIGPNNTYEEKDTCLKLFEYRRYILNDTNNDSEILNTLKESPIELCVEITNHCNFSCPVCIADAGNSKKIFLKLKKYYKILQKLHGKIKRICITGGEPLLHPDFEEFISISTKCCPTILSTNGYSMNHIQTLSLKYSNLIFAISLHGPSIVHDEYVRQVGAYERALKSLKSAISNNAIVHVYTIASKQNIHSIPKLIDILKNYPIRLHKIIPIKNKGRLTDELKEVEFNEIQAKCAKSRISKIQTKSFPYYFLNSNSKLEVINSNEQRK